MNVIVESGLNAAYIVALYGCDRYYIEASSVYQVGLRIFLFEAFLGAIKSPIEKSPKLESGPDSSPHA